MLLQIMGVARKRDVGGYSKLMDKAAKCLHRLFELAPIKKRNYILDQVNSFTVKCVLMISLKMVKYYSWWTLICHII